MLATKTQKSHKSQNRATSGATLRGLRLTSFQLGLRAKPALGYPCMPVAVFVRQPTDSNVVFARVLERKWESNCGVYVARQHRGLVFFCSVAILHRIEGTVDGVQIPVTETM